MTHTLAAEPTPQLHPHIHKQFCLSLLPGYFSRKRGYTQALLLEKGFSSFLLLKHWCELALRAQFPYLESGEY